jgi:putative two-component system response regulator
MSVASILLVEDDESQRLRMRGLLMDKGHTVIEAIDGLDALEALRDHVVSIVITDWIMPRMDGLALCRAIRERSPSYVYIIFLTAQNQMNQLVEGMSAGADDYLTKPVHPAELMIRVAAGERMLTHAAKDLALFALAKLTESRDNATGRHLERVQIYSRILAEHLRQQKVFDEIDAIWVQLIYDTSPLHDIGKVAIPDKILLNPAILTAEEYAIMKGHCETGAKTLRALLQRQPTARYLQMAADIAEYHHEKFDGTGYPHGLMGEAIPLAARIVALVDVYDALTSKRCYKPARSPLEAKNILLGGEGSHFDPRLVQAFLLVEDQFLDVLDQLGETE